MGWSDCPYTDLEVSELCKVAFWFVSGQTKVPAHMRVHCSRYKVMYVILLEVWGMTMMWQKYLRGGSNENVTDYKGA